MKKRIKMTDSKFKRSILFIFNYEYNSIYGQTMYIIMCVFSSSLSTAFSEVDHYLLDIGLSLERRFLFSGIVYHEGQAGW